MLKNRNKIHGSEISASLGSERGSTLVGSLLLIASMLAGTVVYLKSSGNFLKQEARTNQIVAYTELDGLIQDTFQKAINNNVTAACINSSTIENLPFGGLAHLERMNSIPWSAWLPKYGQMSARCNYFIVPAPASPVNNKFHLCYRGKLNNLAMVDSIPKGSVFRSKAAMLEISGEILNLQTNTAATCADFFTGLKPVVVKLHYSVLWESQLQGVDKKIRRRNGRAIIARN